MFISPAMGLTVYNSFGDPYDSEQLADNFLKTDQHDHSQGRGVQIPTAGLRDSAVTTVKISDGAVTSAKMAVGFNIVPTGSVFAWTTSLAPTGFLLCTGQLVAPATYPSLFSILGTQYGGDGISTFGVPDLRQRFILGQGVSGTGSTLGATGGSIDHTHATPAHTHTAPAHVHTLSNNGGALVWSQIFGGFELNYIPTTNGPTWTSTQVWSTNANLQSLTNVVPSTPLTGTTDTNSGGTTGLGGNANTTTNNPPFITLNYIIST